MPHQSHLCPTSPTYVPQVPLMFHKSHLCPTSLTYIPLVPKVPPISNKCYLDPTTRMNVPQSIVHLPCASPKSPQIFPIVIWALKLYLCCFYVELLSCGYICYFQPAAKAYKRKNGDSTGLGGKRQKPQHEAVDMDLSFGGKYLWNLTRRSS